LTAILGYAQLLETEPIGERGLDYVRKLYLQTQRTHRVVQNLLSFSRQRKPIQSKVDLRRVMEDALSLREFDLKLNNIVVERCYDPAAPFITGDAHQLKQVFLNIINNAVDAIMDFAQGGRLGVRIYAEGDRACVEFQDSGPGLTEPQKIFDPFYTTKKIGKGTGLGLSICYGIVKEHGGDILALNPKDGGALFRLKLPIAGPRKTASS
jgi:two-component system, NtrC family, sensor kinase